MKNDASAFFDCLAQDKTVLKELAKLPLSQAAKEIENKGFNLTLGELIAGLKDVDKLISDDDLFAAGGTL